MQVVSHYDQAGIQHFSEAVVGEIGAVPQQTTYILQVKGNGSRYSFSAGATADEMQSVADRVDGSFLGSETAGGFVGAYIGMFASGNGQTKEKYVDFDTFIYEGFEREGEQQR
jgi:alpha-N-arabinofuranosidase